MNGRDVDDELRRLEAASKRVGVNLFELGQDPNIAVLDAADLTGATAATWSSGRAAMTGLFESYASLSALVERAAALRGDRRRSAAVARAAEVDALLRGRSILVADTAVPVGERALLDASRLVQRCSPAELLDRMGRDFDLIRDTLGRVGRVWAEYPARVRDARSRLVTLHSSGAVSSDALACLERAVDEIAALVLSDPLAVDGAPMDELLVLLGAAERDAAVADEARSQWCAQLAAARHLLGEVDAATRDRDAAALFAAARISGATPARPEARHDEDDLTHQLDAILASAGRSEWTSVATELAAWRTRAAAARDASRSTAATQRALVATRDELRGRLDAYRSKATALGRVEAPRLAALHRHAHDVLYTAPADLSIAIQLVDAYRDELASLDGGRAEAP